MSQSQKPFQFTEEQRTELGELLGDVPPWPEMAAEQALLERLRGAPLQRSDDPLIVELALIERFIDTWCLSRQDFGPALPKPKKVAERWRIVEAAAKRLKSALASAAAEECHEDDATEAMSRLELYRGAIWLTTLDQVIERSAARAKDRARGPTLANNADPWRDQLVEMLVTQWRKTQWRKVRNGFSAAPESWLLKFVEIAGAAALEHVGKTAANSDTWRNALRRLKRGGKLSPKIPASLP